MTTVKITRDAEQAIYTVEVAGHAGYADNGKDIVCAGVSAISNMLLAYPEPLAKSAVRSGHLLISFDATAETDKLMKAAYICLERMSIDYPEYLEIIYSRGEKMSTGL